MKNRNLIIRIIVTLLPIILLLAGCAQVKENPPQVTGKVINITEVGNPQIDVKSKDFEEMGYKPGDSLNVSFSSGYTNEDLPYYDGFYGEGDDVMCVNYFEDLSFACAESDFSELAGVKVGDTVTITLKESGKYEKTVELYYLPSVYEKREGKTDLEFANAREVTAGDIKKGRLYRSGSPVNDNFNRTEIVSNYIADNGINTIINLADTEETFAEYKNLTEVMQKAVDSESVYLCTIEMDYDSEATNEAVIKIMKVLADKPTPYLCHCSIGQDRTGFTCTLIEGLCGASYDEIVDDYMTSYSNLYALTKKSDPEKYELYKKRVDDMLTILTGKEDCSKLTRNEIQSSIYEYLRNIGLDEETISRAQSNLCK